MHPFQFWPNLSNILNETISKQTFTMPQPGQSLQPEKAAGTKMPQAPAAHKETDAVERERERERENKECIEVQCFALLRATAAR